MPGNVPLIIRLRKENGEVESAKSTIVATINYGFNSLYWRYDI